MRDIYRTPEGFETLINTFESMAGEFSLIACSAFRYALGRRTYIVSVVCNYIKANVGMIERNHLSLMVREIEDADTFNGLGDACDRHEWLQLKEHIKEYLKRTEPENSVDTMSTKLKGKEKDND
ncbi:MAG: hypothetical protein IKY14_02315 [Erysipelotrichaceae bacterium]|nr:hypothetical protein [Erysipelotrichaceae bacterium]